MSKSKKPLKITELVLRDAHQSLFATRMRLEDMLPIAEQLDKVGYWTLETWGGATFDSCIRFLGEDPWERLRALKKAMPNTPQQMLFRGQNILGYRHYADDVVEKFVERAAVNGIDVFRVFDAMNDPRNLETAIKGVIKQEKHAQGCISYTVSPVHTIAKWVELAKTVEDMGAHSLCIKDMAGLITPAIAYEMVKKIKKAVDIPLHMHCHATTGMSTAAYLKAIEAGIDGVDTAISSMSLTYAHSPTETLVAINQGTERDTGLDLAPLQEIAAYFREVRKKYANFEGSLKGIDSRIIMAQVPGGMLTNMESQLREQGASDKIDQVLKEIPFVREDLGFLPLVTPTSQIVGSQAVLNVLAGERFKAMTKETIAVLKGEYGATPAPVNKELQKRVLKGGAPITCRPADLLEPEVERLSIELREIAAQKNLTLAEAEIDDVLTYALFTQVGLKFIENRNNPAAFEPTPTGLDAAPVAAAAGAGETYTVTGGGKSFVVQVAGAEGAAAAAAAAAVAVPGGSAAQVSAETLDTAAAHLAGNIWKIEVAAGDTVEEGDLLFILEAMKMEHEVLAEQAGVIQEILVKEGDAVELGAPLLSYVGNKSSAASPAPATAAPAAGAPVAIENGVSAPLAGNIWKLEVTAGQHVQEGDLLIILEAMKMENEIIAERDGTVGEIFIREGDAVDIGQVLLALA